MGAGALSRLIEGLRDSLGDEVPEQLLVGLGDGDDALVWKLSDESALIATTDFFTPIVDDPYQYGAIAAANAMSDVFAMGGRVALALNVAAFPKDLPPEICSEILKGGAEKVREAGGIIGGGHTIFDDEPKYGLCVMGFVHPDRIVRKAGALPEDRLYLTKPIGTGLITTAAKGRKARDEHIEGAIVSMSTLNNAAIEVALQADLHAATDITGFGLLGHTSELATSSGVDLEIHFPAVPLLEGVDEYASLSIFPGGTHNNLKHFGPRVDLDGDVTEQQKLILMTPETSGGLCLAVGTTSEDGFHREMKAAGLDVWPIGRVIDGTGRIRVRA